MKNDFAEILEKFADVAVLVVGDLMLDRYFWGSVERISPEAPVPIVKVARTTLTAGGAANVAANVAGLGAKVYLVAAVGADADGLQVPEILRQSNVAPENLIEVRNRPTTLKTRVVAHSQHVVRIDQETAENLSPEDESRAWALIERIIAEVTVIIVSDYAKGFLSDNLLMRLITSARETGKILMVDPKGRDYRKYRGATIITPNKKEAAEAAGDDEQSPEIVARAGGKLLAELQLDAVLITQGEGGMTLFEKSHAPTHFASQARHVYDVTGAGDTVIAALAVAAAAGADLKRAAQIANAAAGFVVEQVGTTSVTRAQLENHFAVRRNQT